MTEDGAPALPPDDPGDRTAPYRRDVLERRRHPDRFGEPVLVPRGGLGRMVGAGLRAFAAIARSGAVHRRRDALRHFRQVEAADCGAAAVATVLDYFGIDVTLKDLRQEVGAGRGGASARMLVRTARAHGLRARGVQADVDQVELLPRASILHWNLDHFVVLDHVTSRGAWIVDPALGRRFVSKEALGRSFTGVALVFEGERVVRRHRDAEARRSAWGNVLPLLRGHGLWRSIVVAAMLGQLLLLSFPFLLRYVLDNVIAVDAHSAIAVIAVAAVPLLVVHLLVLGIRSVSLSWLRGRVDFELSVATFNKLLSLPYPYFARRTTGDLLLRVRSTAALRQVFTTAVLSGIVDGATAIGLIAVVTVLDLRLGLVTIGAVSLQLLTLVLAWRHQRELTATGLEAQSQSQARLVELLTGAQSVKLAGAESACADAWTQMLAAETNWEVTRSIASGIIDGTLQALRLATPIALLVVGASEVLDRGITTGTMVAALSLATAALVPVTAMMGTGFQLAAVRGHLDRLNDVFDEESEIDTGSEPGAEASLRAESVSFSYANTAAPVVAGVDVDVPPGASLAVMGPSGSGKSTLAMLLAGMYRPGSGTVSLGGVDVALVPPRVLREWIAVVPQHPHFFRGTVRDNITMFRDIPDAQVRQAARVACIDTDVLALPMGFDTPMAERGESLSGGQLQRIGLARALVNEPRVLILDEATSALDAETEARVIDRLLATRLTIVFVTHRESVAARADRTIALRDGHLA